MNREDMIRMAKEAGWQYAHGESGYEPLWEFAALVASAAVRETSAEYRLGWNDGQIAEREAVLDLIDGYAKNNTDLAEAIRARGQA